MGKKRNVVGIVTINDYTNYGNRLQNYALTSLLHSEGIEVINGIRVYTKQDYVANTNNQLKKFVKYMIPFYNLKKRLMPKVKSYSSLMKEREQNFIQYAAKYTHSIEPIVVPTYNHAMKILTDYGIDYFITGSDQVWNPYYEGRNDEFLTFAPKDKRLSFAASIGSENIPSHQIARYRKNLSEMKYLSVREQRAVEIIKELTGRTADLTLDPTLLLEQSEWQELVQKPQVDLKGQYICTYFLGETPKAIEPFAKEKHLPIYALNSQKEPELYTLNPGEFLYMIQNAAYVLTDSFHAVAFSIKFHKEFYVFDRKQENVSSMFSRIETITKRFSLENRIQNRDTIAEQMPIEHWNTIDQALLVEKERSMRSLLDAMEIS